jgi:serine/threonine protein kinase
MKPTTPPPPPSITVFPQDPPPTYDHLKSQSKSLVYVASALHSVAQQNQNNSPNFISLVQLLIDIKFEEEERDQLLHREVIAAMVQQREILRTEMNGFYPEGTTVPDFVPFIQNLESQTDCVPAMNTINELILNQRSLWDSILNKGTHKADADHLCNQRDSVRRNLVHLIEIKRAGYNTWKEIRKEREERGEEKEKVTKIQAALQKFTPESSELQTIIANVSQKNADIENSIGELYQRTLAAQQRRKQITDHAQSYVNDMQQQMSIGEDCFSNMKEAKKIEGDFFVQEKMLHLQRMRLIKPMEDLKHLAIQTRQEKRQIQKLTIQWDEALEDDTLTPQEEEKMEHRIKELQDSIDTLSRRMDGLQESIRTLCFDAISWQRHYHPRYQLNKGEGETKNTSSDEMLELCYVFPDVWEECSNIRLQIKHRKRRSSSPAHDMGPLLQKLDRHGLLLVGRSFEDYNDHDLPQTMISGTEHHPLVNGRRLRGINPKKSLKILKTVTAADIQNSQSKNIRAALIYAYRLKHKYVVPVEGAFLDKQNIVIQTPFFEGGNLRQWSNEAREEVSKVNVMSKVAEAAAFLHDNNLIHRDLKPGNIVMTSSKDNANPAVTDFDISKSVQSNFMTTTRIGLGTERYMAPELKAQPPEPPTFKCDVYSMGVTFLELLLCDCNELKLMKLVTESGTAINELDWHKVAAAEYKKIESTALRQRGQAMKLLVSMVARNPDDRPAAAEVARVLREVAAGLGSYDCLSCYDSFELNAGVLCCGKEQHFLCRTGDDCFNKHIKLLLEGTEVNTFKCAYCAAVYPEKILNFNMNDENAKKLREKREEAVATKTRHEEKERYEEERKREEAKSELEKQVGIHRKRIEEEVMTLRCPECNLAIVEYNGCAALKCGRTIKGQEGGCGTAFCAVCFANCKNESNDAHNHCKHTHGTWSVSTPDWQEMMRALKEKRLVEYWGGIPEKVRGKLLEDASIRTHFQDLRMAVPDEGEFAAELAQLHGMGFHDDRKNVLVLKEVGGDIQQVIALLLGYK